MDDSYFITLKNIMAFNGYSVYEDGVFYKPYGDKVTLEKAQEWYENLKKDADYVQINSRS